MKSIMIATLLVGLIGLFIGIVLGIASEKFKVVVDEKEQKIRSVLPGNNCGGCGYAGCDALAKAIANGEAAVNACPVGGAPVAEQVGEIMGISADDSVKEVAFVKCAGTCDKTKDKDLYFGIHDCNAAMNVPGTGSKSCSYGCLGYGSCEKACPFDAIHVIDGIA